MVNRAADCWRISYAFGSSKEKHPLFEHHPPVDIASAAILEVMLFAATESAAFCNRLYCLRSRLT